MTTESIISKRTLWAGRTVSGLAILFFLMDGIMKLVKPAPVIEATVRLGYPESTILPIGIVLLSCTLLHIIPRTAILGAIVLTGYLGGAIATHVRAGSNWFDTLFPAVFGILVWLGLWLRDRRLRALLPFTLG